MTKMFKNLQRYNFSANHNGIDGANFRGKMFKNLQRYNFSANHNGHTRVATYREDV